MLPDTFASIFYFSIVIKLQQVQNTHSLYVTKPFLALFSKHRAKYTKLYIPAISSNKALTFSSAEMLQPVLQGTKVLMQVAWVLCFPVMSVLGKRDAQDQEGLHLVLKGGL